MVLSTELSARNTDDTPQVRRRRRRIDGRSKTARRITAKVADFTARLSTVASDPMIGAAIVRLAETEVVCEDQRERALRSGAVDLLGLNRLENTCRRLRADLGLDMVPLKPVPKLPSIAEIRAGRYD